jgi:membrane protease YdiL (CAAX protease family)
VEPSPDKPDIFSPLPPSEPLKPQYPPPGEAFLVLVTALIATIMIGASTATMGRVGLFLSELFFLVPPLFYLRKRGFSIKRCLRWNSVPVTVLISTILIGFALVILLDELDRVMSLVFPMPEYLQKALSGFFELKTWQDYAIVGFGVVVIAAVCEESLFRGFMQVSFEAHGNVTRAVLITALFFAVAHFNPWWMVQILILGVVLGFISWRSGSSLPGMVVHGLNNGLALAAGGDTTGTKWAWYNTGRHVSPAILIAAGTILFLGFKFFLRSTENSFQEDIVPDETTPA